MTLVFLSVMCRRTCPPMTTGPSFAVAVRRGSVSGNPPVRWNIETGENILWKTPIEGLAHSSPIVWGDRVFVTTAVNATDTEPTLGTGWLGGTGKSAEDVGLWSWQLHAYDLATGQQVWKREAAAGQPLMKRHLKATHANCTPVTNGEYVVAFFGAEGLYCFDMSGNLVWKTGFGRLHAGPYDARELRVGIREFADHSSTSTLLSNVIVSTHRSWPSCRLADGTEVRRIPRSDVTTWSTPLVIQVDRSDATRLQRLS